MINQEEPESDDVGYYPGISNARPDDDDLVVTGMGGINHPGYDVYERTHLGSYPFEVKEGMSVLFGQDPLQSTSKPETVVGEKTMFSESSDVGGEKYNVRVMDTPVAPTVKELKPLKRGPAEHIGPNDSKKLLQSEPGSKCIGFGVNTDKETASENPGTSECDNNMEIDKEREFVEKEKCGEEKSNDSSVVNKSQEDIVEKVVEAQSTKSVESTPNPEPGCSGVIVQGDKPTGESSKDKSDDGDNITGSGVMDKDMALSNVVPVESVQYNKWLNANKKKNKNKKRGSFLNILPNK